MLQHIVAPWHQFCQGFFSLEAEIQFNLGGEFNQY